MIKPNELRIGNLVECSGKVTKINSIHTIFAFSTMGHAVDLLYNNDAYVESARVEDINPIPITHDWIRKLGFNLLSGGWYKSGYIPAGWIVCCGLRIYQISNTYP